MTALVTSGRAIASSYYPAGPTPPAVAPPHTGSASDVETYAGEASTQLERAQRVTCCGEPEYRSDVGRPSAPAMVLTSCESETSDESFRAPPRDRQLVDL